MDMSKQDGHALVKYKRYINKRKIKPVKKTHDNDLFSCTVIKPIRAVSVQSNKRPDSKAHNENGSNDNYRDVKLRYQVYTKDGNLNSSLNTNRGVFMIRDPDFLDLTARFRSYNNEIKSPSRIGTSSSRNTPFTNELLISSNISVDSKSNPSSRLLTSISSRAKNLKLQKSTLKFIQVSSREPLKSSSISPIFLKRSLLSSKNTDNNHVFDIKDLFNIANGKLRLKKS